MSKTKLLLDVVSDLHSLAESVEKIVEAIEQPENTAEEPKSEKKPKKNKPEITLEQVRAALAQKSNSGFTAEVRELLVKHGADRLSNIDPSEYAALLADAEALRVPDKTQGLVGRGGAAE